jgi:hypothetical protein
MTVRDLTTALQREGALRETLPDELAEALDSGKGSFQKRLGKALAQRVEMRHGESGVYVQRVGQDPRKRVVQWAVRGFAGVAGFPRAKRRSRTCWLRIMFRDLSPSL